LVFSIPLFFSIAVIVSLFPYLLQLILVLCFYRKDIVRLKKTYLPNISIVLPVYNEEKIIENTLENLLELNYPKNLLEIIVVDGCSTDMTVKLVDKFRDKGIELIREKERRGVTEAVKKGVLSSRGEIILMTDAEALIEQNALNFLVEDLSDPSVGAVSGIQVLANRSENAVTRMESEYRKWYDMLRIAESNANSTFNFRGEFVAVRRELFPFELKGSVLDAAIAFNAIRAGYKSICDERIKFLELAPDTLEDRNKQKIQRATLLQETILQNLGLVFRLKNKGFGSLFFICDFFIFFVSPIMFAMAFLLFPFVIIHFLSFQEFVPILGLTVAILFTKRITFFSFVHSQICLIISLLRNMCSAQPRLLSQVKGTRKNFSPIE